MGGAGKGGREVRGWDLGWGLGFGVGWGLGWVGWPLGWRLGWGSGAVEVGSNEPLKTAKRRCRAKRDS